MSLDDVSVYPDASTTIFDDENRRLLQSIVDVARAIFDAAASSIFIVDRGAGDLVFEAVSGAGEGTLVGQRIPANRGIAGWALTSGQPFMVDDLSANVRFARDIAESTGYVPRTLIAAPLLHQGEGIGVLEILDHRSDPRRTLGDLELLGLFASQAAIALDVVRHSQAGMAGLLHDDSVTAVAVALGALTGTRKQAGLQLLKCLHQILADDS